MKGKRRNKQQLGKEKEMIWKREIILSKDIFMLGDVIKTSTFTSRQGWPLTSSSMLSHCSSSGKNKIVLVKRRWTQQDGPVL